MRTFGEYYRSVFRGDLTRFLMSIPFQSRHHHGTDTYTIQYSKLCRDAPHMDTIPSEHRSYFAIALVFTVLVDQVCYTYFSSHYEDFRRLTLYPKFIGDCPGGCYHNIHPSLIFEAINRSWFKDVFPERGHISLYKHFIEAKIVMEEEIFDFFTKHMTIISPEVFWAKCVDEFPTRNQLWLYDNYPIPWIHCQVLNPMEALKLIDKKKKR